MLRFTSICSLLVVFFFSIAEVAAQDSETTGTSNPAKLKPLVQVFSSTLYNPENGYVGMAFGRAHLGFQYQFDTNWSAKMIIDRGRPTTVGPILLTDTASQGLILDNTSKEGAYYTMHLKFASLCWRVNQRLAIEGGAILQNHYITQERFWGLRYVAQTFQDKYWKIPSTDLGFLASYKISKYFSVDAAITNGEGPRLQQDASGKMKLAGGLDIFPTQKTQIRIYGHSRQTGVDTLFAEKMLSLFFGYKPGSKFRMGGEFNIMDKPGHHPGLSYYGYSLYTAYQIRKETSVFLRYDRLLSDLEPSVLPSMEQDGNAVFAGVSYSPVNGVNLSLNYQAWFEQDTEPLNNLLFSFEYHFE